MAKETIGFVGIGMMGLPMATRLINAGHEVVAYDRRTEALDEIVKRGAKRGKSIADVASATEIVLVSLPKPDVVREVVLGRGGITEGNRRTIVVDLSTTGPTVATEVSKGLEQHGVTSIDAPVSGGVSGAEKGTLAVMVSGPKAQAERLKPVLEVFGKFFYIGETAGQAQMMKLINNLLSATAMAATTEAMVLGTKAGLDPAVMIDVINAGSGRNTATADKFPRSILPRTFDFGFAMGLMTKDVNLCLQEADALQMPMWIGTSVQQMWRYGLQQGGPDVDFTSLIKYVEKWAGVTVEGHKKS